MNQYSRSQPSPRYVELLNYYHDMHAHGAVEQKLDAKQTFDGRSLGAHVNALENIIKVLGSKTLLDYGAGKGSLYKATNISRSDGTRFAGICDLWDVDAVTLYDPAYPPHSVLPDGVFDGVICTDVMEHCPADDVPWILDEIFSFAREFVYINVACYPARKTLPNGENAHCTVKPPEWWLELFETRLASRPGLRYYACFDLPAQTESGETVVSQINHFGKNPIP